MADTGMPAQGEDATTEVIVKILGALLAVAAVLLLLPLVIPVIATAIAGEQIATRARFWMRLRHHALIAAAGIALVVLLVGTELVLLAGGADHGDLPPLRLEELNAWAGVVAPWLVANFVSGALLLPLAWALHRRRIADRVRTRRISDVVRQNRIESARKRAADASAAAEIGIRLDTATGKILGTQSRVVTAPLDAGAGRRAFAFVTQTTVTTFREKFRDRRSVRDWITDDGRLVLVPPTSSSVRALVIAESGSGKTVLMNSIVLCALDYGWPVFFLDAKGDPQDAQQLAALAAARNRTAAVGGGWDLFTGTADQITAKLMRLMPAPDGANQHYLDEIRGVLQAVQADAPIDSVPDLRDRLMSPGPHVRDQYDLQLVNASVDRNGTTAGTRALQSLLVALRPLEPWLDPEGWSYNAPRADLTIVPLSPVDDAQARLGDLLLLDLRNFLATRLARRDKSPVLVIVDEFPQLVTGTSDPGDTAGSLFETARSAGVGLILATQSPAGLSNDEIRRRRALTSGAALIFGRSKDPEDVVAFAGTVMQLESTGAAAGDELKSARAQHTYVVPPQDVREASDGAFWIVQGGAMAPFRALPQAPPPAPVLLEADELPDTEAEPEDLTEEMPIESEEVDARHH